MKRITGNDEDSGQRREDKDAGAVACPPQRPGAAEAAAAETGLPATDPVRFGAEAILEAVV